MGVMMVSRKRFKMALQCFHELSQNGVQGRVEEIWSEVVDAQLQRSEPLCHKFWASAES